MVIQKTLKRYIKLYRVYRGIRYKEFGKELLQRDEDLTEKIEKLLIPWKEQESDLQERQDRNNDMHCTIMNLHAKVQNEKAASEN